MQKDGFASMNHSAASPDLGFVVLATIPRVTSSMGSSHTTDFPPKNSQKRPTDHVPLDVSVPFDNAEKSDRSTERYAETRWTEGAQTMPSEPLVLPGTPVFTVQAVPGVVPESNTADAVHTAVAECADSSEKLSVRRMEESVPHGSASRASREENRPQVVASRNLPEASRGRRRDWRVPMGVAAMLVVAFGVIHTIRQTIPEPIGPHSDLSQQIANSDAQKEKLNPRQPEAKINLTELEPMSDFGSAVTLPSLTASQPTNHVTQTTVSSSTPSAAAQTASLPMTDAIAQTGLPMLPEAGLPETNVPGTPSPKTTLPGVTDSSPEIAQNGLEIPMTPPVNTVEPVSRFDSRFIAEPRTSDPFAAESLATDRFATDTASTEPMLPLPNGVAIAADASQVQPAAQPTDATVPQNDLPPLPAISDTTQPPIASSDQPTSTDGLNDADSLKPIETPDYPDTGYVEITLPTVDSTPAYPNTEHGEIVIPSL